MVGYPDSDWHPTPEPVLAARDTVHARDYERVSSRTFGSINVALYERRWSAMLLGPMKVVVAPLAGLLLMASTGACGEDDAGSRDPLLLQGVPWLLASGLDVEGWEEAAPSATFENGRVAGSTGCNHYTAPYSLADEALDIGQIASTRMACPPPADAVERGYLAALERVTAWLVESGELALLDADGRQVLRYTVGTPVGAWKATGIPRGGELASPIAGTEITALFDTSGTLSGSAGCNTYTATYTANRGGIEIAEVAATEKACSEPDGIMEQESVYLRTLATAARYRVAGRSLQLLGADGLLLATYSRTNAP